MTETEKNKMPTAFKHVLMSFKPAAYNELIAGSLLPAAIAILLLGFLQAGYYVADMLNRWPDETRKVRDQWTAQYPAVKISNGVATSTETAPVTGEITAWNYKFDVTVDTTGATKDIDAAATTAALLTSAELVIKQTSDNRGPSTNRVALAKMNEAVGDIVLDAQGIDAIAEKIKWRFIGSTVIQGIIAFAFLKSAHIFIGMLIALIVTAIYRKRIAYKILFILAGYAMIPATLADTFFIFTQKLYPAEIYKYFFFAYIALYVTYLALASMKIERS